MFESEMAAVVAGGMTMRVCPPDTDPVLDESGLVDMLKFDSENWTSEPISARCADARSGRRLAE